MEHCLVSQGKDLDMVSFSIIIIFPVVLSLSCCPCYYCNSFAKEM